MRSCPRCHQPFTALRGVFGDGPEAARVKGASTLARPVHLEPTVRVHVRWVGDVLDDDRTDECRGGMFFDEGQWVVFGRAARVVLSEYADRVHRNTGEFAGEEAIVKQIAAGGAAMEEAVTRGAIDRASQHMAFRGAVKHLRRWGGYGGYGHGEYY